MEHEGALTRITDAMVRLFSPRAQARRMHFRRMESSEEYRNGVFALMGARGYRAAADGKTKTTWLGGDGSADAEILGNLPALRAKSRELNRDDSVGSGITETFVNNVVGTGLRPQARTGDMDKDQRIESVWTERAASLSLSDGLTYPETQRMVFRKWFEDGDAIRKNVKRRPMDPIWFETIEAERLATPTKRSMPLVKAGENEIRDGVERDAAGVPVAYWIMKHHPGEIFTPDNLEREKFVRVLASEVRHLKTTERPGQTRGVPAFHAILQDVRDLDLLLLASLKRVQIAACLAVILESPEDTQDVFDVTAQKYGLQLDQKLEPGMMFKTYPGEQAKTLIPNFPTPELAPFIIVLARRIGAALGVCWQMVLKDFSDSTYSSARTDLLESRITFLVRRSVLVEKILTPEWVAVMQDARLRGDTRLRGVTDDDIRKVQWIAPGWKWVDPQKEALATKVSLQLGITTQRDVCAANGEDWEEVMRQRLVEEKREDEIRQELGLRPRVQPQPVKDKDLIEPDDPKPQKVAKK